MFVTSGIASCGALAAVRSQVDPLNVLIVRDSMGVNTYVPKTYVVLSSIVIGVGTVMFLQGPRDWFIYYLELARTYFCTHSVIDL